MKKFLALIMVVMIIVMGISIERDMSTSQQENIYEKYINYNMKANPDNLKQTTSVNVREKDLLLNLFEGLVKEDEDGNIVGALSETFTVSEDGLEYQFNLRKDIYYSSGEKIDTEDFANFFKAFLQDEENIYRKELDCIYGAKDFEEGKIDFSQVAIIPKDDVLIIRLNYPCPYLLNILANPVYVLRDYNQVNDYKNNFKDIRYTGSFVVDEASEKQLLLSRNEKYYDYKEVIKEPVRISFIESTENALAIFEDVESKTTEKVDIMLDVPINEISRLNKQKMIEEYKGNTVVSLKFNNKEESLSSTMDFRSAISDALDREEYAELISKDLLIPTYISTPIMDDAIEVFRNDMGIEVKNYFKEVNKDEELSIKVVYEDNSLERRIAKELCEQLKEITEIEFIPGGYSKEELSEIISKGEYDIFIDTFQFEYNYEGEYYEDLVETLKESKEYKEVLNEVKYEADESIREGILARCEEVLWQELSVIPLYEVNNIACIKRDFEGVHVTNGGNIILSNVKRVR